MRFAIDAVRVGERKRPLGDVTSLAQSIQAIGLLNPITILSDGMLVAGYHRLEACKRLGWTEIETNVVDLETLDAELAEIDENLIRSELHWFDRDKQLARRKELYELKYPATKKGNTAEKAFLQAVNPNCSDSQLAFTQDAANKLKISRDTVENSVKRAVAFTDEQGEVLKRANVKPTEATKLARQPEPERTAIIQALADEKAKTVVEAKTVVKREQLIEQAKQVILPDTLQIFRGHFLDSGNAIADGSVDLIFTDPPYHEAQFDLWSDLAFFASRVLKPGGILLAYSGQMFLPVVLSRLSHHLEYCWLLSVQHTGGHIQIWKHNVWNDWKPLVMFGKGKPVAHEWLMDLYRGDKGDKGVHEWSQGEGEASYYIEKLTQPGQLVVDPMCGSGTILRAAHKLGRHSIGIEVDQNRFDVAIAGVKDLEGVAV